jgi:CubicO group peptidase (beta-lactamase class C family)
VGEFGYSNANSEILGLIVQTVSGRSYEDYVRQHIFAPLDMRNSFVSQDEALQHGMASGHRWWFGFPVPFTLPYNRAELPAGYIISSAEDMTHFLIAQLNGGRYREHAVLSPDGIASTHAEPLPRTYAMEWENDRLDGHLVIDHDGGTANFQSSVFFDPEARVGVFIAANVISGLDAFSSPPGSSPVDGVTVRAMAKSVLTLASTNPARPPASKPLPPRAGGHHAPLRPYRGALTRPGARIAGDGLSGGAAVAARSRVAPAAISQRTPG